MKIFDFWKSYFYVLLLHPTESKILLQLTKDKYGLPLVEIDRAIWCSDVRSAKDAIEEQLNFTVNILHYAGYRIDKKKREIRGIYVLEQHDVNEKIRFGTWCDLSNLEGLSFTCSEHKSIVKKYLLELNNNSNIPEFRPPWAKPGWFGEASTWIEEQLRKLKYHQISSVEYVKSWSISCILKVKTTKGIIYFKESSSCLPLFCDEPVVTTELASLFPKHIPTVMSIDRQRHWMLLADFGEPLGNNASFKVQQEIYHLFAGIQIQSVQHSDRLLAVGCLDRRLNILQSQIDPLINDEDILSELSAAEIDKLHALAPKLKTLCTRLSGYNIPETLVHGDLHFNNVALFQDNYLFFDWTDTCISHPFFDLFELFFDGHRNSVLGNLKSLCKQKYKKHLRDRYLSQWKQYEPRERLLDAWNIAKPLCALHHTVTYQNIFHSLELRAKREFGNVIPSFLRKIIEFQL